MEEGVKSIALWQFRIQILQTRESEQEPRELARFLIQILCIMPAVVQGYCGSSVQDEEESAQAGEQRGSYYRSPGEKFRGNNEDLSLGGDKEEWESEARQGLGEPMKSPFFLLYGAQSSNCSFTSERWGI